MSGIAVDLRGGLSVENEPVEPAGCFEAAIH
jgi:hypothetical protein